MNIALLTAAGIGSRMHQDIPKQFMHVNDKPLIIYTLEKFDQHPGIDAIVVVTIESWINVLEAYVKQFEIKKIKAIIPGGETNQDSIFNGVEYIHNLYNDDDIIVIHDGNRCAVSSEIISNNLAVCSQNGSAITSIPCTEVLFKTNSQKVATELLERKEIVRTQTPHSFLLSNLWKYIMKAKEQDIKNTAALCELMDRLGEDIYFSKGSELNLKITTVDDLFIFKSILNINDNGIINR